MRTIKFRAWYPKTKDMYLDVGVFKEPVDGYGAVIISRDDKDFILMQYIGLKDKRNRDIYEGDIVDWGTGRAEVKFVEEQDKGGIMTSPYINQDTEVIGNIYENPELLKTK